MRSIRLFIIIIPILIVATSCKRSEREITAAINSISATDLEYHLQFLAADEFSGRNTPSTELKIASRYLAGICKNYGLRTLIPGNTYYQEIPLETAIIDTDRTRINFRGNGKNSLFTFPGDFGIDDSNLNSSNINGSMVFAGLGFRSPGGEWDDLGMLDIADKIVVILEPRLPDSHALMTGENRMLFRNRADRLSDMGAKAVIRVIDDEREIRMAGKGLVFDNPLKSRVLDKDNEGVAGKTSATRNIIIRQNMASRILGISAEELSDMFTRVRNGERIKGFPLDGKSLDINIEIKNGYDTTRNVLGLLEGSDPGIKDEYVIFTAHYDHLGIIEGEVYNGANDNGSGTVALVEIAEAMSGCKPSRSIIFAWLSGEEKGLWGSEYFVSNCPVPLEKITACINLDVVGGEDLSKITVIGSASLSSEFDEIINAINEKYFNVRLDYMADNPSMERFFFTRSDHYPFIKNGIPSVWLGSESDPQDYIHTPNDTAETINYEKVEMITEYSFLLGMEVASHRSMMPLDKNPEITVRGRHNIKYRWEN